MVALCIPSLFEHLQLFLPFLLDSFSSQESSSWQNTHFPELPCGFSISPKSDVKIVHSCDSLTLRLGHCEACGSIVVMRTRHQGRKKAGSYLWKAGSNNSVLAKGNGAVHTSLQTEWYQVSCPSSVEWKQERGIMSGSWSNMSNKRRKGWGVISFCHAQVWLCQSCSSTYAVNSPSGPLGLQ